MFTSYSKPVVCPSWCSGGHLSYDVPPGDLIEHSRTFGVNGDYFQQVGRESMTDPVEVDLCQMEGDDGEISETYLWFDGRAITLDQGRLLANVLLAAIEEATR